MLCFWMQESFVFLDGCHGRLWGGALEAIILGGATLIHNAMLAEKKMNHGGKRSHAGRKKGSGRYGEATRAIRIPVSLIDTVQRLCQEKVLTAQAEREVSSPTPADHSAPSKTLLEMLALHAAELSSSSCSLLLPMMDESMRDAGINQGDLLVIDCTKPAQTGQIVAIVANGKILVRKLVKEKGTLMLEALHPQYPSFSFTSEQPFIVLGVVTRIIRAI